ncbi:hypothetical protein SSX86_003759 [Deinandra increscens subsp. villosa]|uniref:NADH dehydrogenase [ubiquinone] iron-sulfur protein 4, mitochondrial n=1 Tax=Deinandra increscens subsp. villosa TaxID=3103831 RepID=A0AAP0H858_9ASTR
MAKILQRGFRLPLFRSDRVSSLGTRSFASDALVEINPGEVGIISGIPQEQLRRRVLIYSPARTASQQGSGKVGKWKINFLSTQKWENPLMGWTSTGDPYANVGDAGLSFNSEEAAKAFAEKHGWEYELEVLDMMMLAHTSVLGQEASHSYNQGAYLFHTAKSYADNFKWKGPPKTDQNY